MDMRSKRLLSPKALLHHLEQLQLCPCRPGFRNLRSLDQLSSSSLAEACCLLLFLRQTIFLPVVGLVDADTMKPGDLVGVNKDSYLILDTLPSEYDSRVKAMEVRLSFHKSR